MNHRHAPFRSVLGDHRDRDRPQLRQALADELKTIDPTGAGFTATAMRFGAQPGWWTDRVAGMVRESVKREKTTGYISVA